MISQARYFFVPPLDVLSEKLKLSPSIAGITLLAIGNGKWPCISSYKAYDRCVGALIHTHSHTGAPDIFTAVAALNNQNDLALLLRFVLHLTPNGSGIIFNPYGTGYFNPNGLVEPHCVFTM